jgi:cellulose synthase (UDP-forming)
MLVAILKKLRMLTLVAAISVCVYFVARVVLFAYSDYTRFEKLFGLFLLFGETYMLVHAFGYMMNVFKLTTWKAEPKLAPPQPGHEPAVAIVVAARHEPREVLEETIITFRNVDYPNKTIYFLDDSSDQSYLDEADELARKHGIKIFRRTERHGAKAGIVNDFVRSMPEKYLAIFDADQNPMPEFLNDIIPILEGDPKLAFVQTPQFYTNIGESPVAKGAAMQQAIFYETICEGKNATGSMFCCGTNVVFRKEALLDVGGFEEEFITEDFATSVNLHRKGWRSWYHNHVAAFGRAPETLPAYFKQQARWAGGTISVFRKLILLFSRHPGALSPMQWWEYFLAGTYYFVGWAFFLLMICPIAFLLFNIPSFFLDPRIYVTVYMPYFCLTLLIFFATMKERHYNFKQIYYGLILGSLCFPLLMKASVYGLMGKRMTFVVTTKGRAEVLPLAALWPYGVMMGLNIAAIVIGLARFAAHPYAIAVNIFWVCYHMFILWNILYFNQLPELGREETASWHA